MKTPNLPANLKEKIYQIEYSQNDFSKIISYFPLSDDEKQLLFDLNNLESFNVFSSIFSGHISDEEWDISKVQIKKRFNDELFDID